MVNAVNTNLSSEITDNEHENIALVFEIARHVKCIFLPFLYILIVYI